MNILILGANGFIGSHLIAAILEKTDWTIDAFDLTDSNIRQYGSSPAFTFTQGDIFTADEWLKTDPQMPKSIWWYSDCFHVGFRVVMDW